MIHLDLQTDAQTPVPRLSQRYSRPVLSRVEIIIHSTPSHFLGSNVVVRSLGRRRSVGIRRSGVRVVEGTTTSSRVGGLLRDDAVVSSRVGRLVQPIAIIDAHVEDFHYKAKTIPLICQRTGFGLVEEICALRFSSVLLSRWCTLFRWLST